MIFALLPTILVAAAVFVWSYPRDIVLSIGNRAPTNWTTRYTEYVKTLDLNISPNVIAGIRLGGFIFGIGLTILLWLSLGVFWSFLGLLIALLSQIIPDYYLAKKEKQRIEELSREFPSMVTLVQVFSKASDLQNALGIVRGATTGELHKQLSRLGIEMNIYPMSVALNNFADRCNYLPISNFVSVLQYGIASGADVDSILDTFSSRTYESRVNEVKRKIKSRPATMVIISGIMMLCLILLFVLPMYSNIVSKLNAF